MHTLGSLFDGIGGFPLAAVHNGITPLWASEIEAFPIEVTKLRFPGMRHFGDITQLDGATLPPVDVITGGSPCQDLSVAGQRAGLAGERSGLFMEQIRIVKEMRRADGQSAGAAHAVRPRYMVWENVPGAFSSANGEDFRAVLEETCRIADDGVSVPGPPAGVWKPAGAILGSQFSVAWRVLDAQYWGVAQRRKRIFLVADFGGRTAAKILFEQDSLFGDTATGASPREGAAPTAPAGAGVAGGDCLTPWDVQSRRVFGGGGVWPALYSGGGGVHGYVKPEEKQALVFSANQRDEVRDLGGSAGALQARPGMKQQTFVSVPVNTQIAARHQSSAENCLTPWDTQQGRVFTPDGISPTLTGADGGGGRNPAGLLFSAGVVTKGNGECIVTPEKHTSLTAGGGQAGQGYPCVLTAGFSAGAVPAAEGIGYQEECAPTLKGSPSGTNMALSILCLNDQGGQRMDLYEDLCCTLRSQMDGHPPLVLGSQQGGAEICGDINPANTAAADGSGNGCPALFENHGIDSRYNGPHDVATTMSARYGTGGNNVPLVSSPTAYSFDGKESNSMKSNNPHSGCRETDLARTLDTLNPDPSKNQGGIAILQESYCIAGNTIDRQAHNGGNGLGCQTDISYTLNTADRHAVFSQQRSDKYEENDVVSTQAARQRKDATDLVCNNTYQQTVGTIGYSDHKGVNNQFVGVDKCVVEKKSLIRRLTPLECERLQGFPDGWTDLPSGSDSARYKALGNSVAIPCVEFVMRGVVYFLRQADDEQGNADTVR